MNELIIESGRVELNYWRDLWTFRELFYFLAWRDILVRYKQTVIGVAWAVIQPFLTTVVFTLVFNRIAKLPAPPGVPYFLVVMAAQLPWQFFSASLSTSSNSLIANGNLISKIYFPRLHHTRQLCHHLFLVDFLDHRWTGGSVDGFGLKFLPDWRLLVLPFYVVLVFGAAFGAGLWLSALNVKYRDFRYIIPFIVQFGFFLSPVGYSSSLVPGSLVLARFCCPGPVAFTRSIPHGPGSLTVSG